LRLDSPRLKPGPAGQLVLALVRPLGLLWRILGVDRERLILLIELRFLISARSTLGAAQHLKGIGIHLGMTALAGLGVAFLVGLQDSTGSAMVIGQGIVLFFMAFNMVFVLNEFLFDEAEGTVVRPTPVEDRTVVVARLVHAGGYLALLAGALTLPAIVTGAIRMGPVFGFAFALATGLSTLLALALFLLMCGGALRVVGTRRFKSAVGWAQLILLLGLYGLQYSVPFLIETLEAVPMLQQRGWWCLGFPPLWSAGLYEVLSGQSVAWSVPMALMAFGLPLVLLGIALRLARRGFLEAVAERGVVANPSQRVTWLDRAGRRLNHSGAQGAGWLILQKGGLRDARFRLRVMPAIALPIMGGAVLLLRDSGNFGARQVALAFLYLPIVGLCVLDGSSYSERYRAAWVFEAAPIEGFGGLRAGLLRLTLLTTVVIPGALLAMMLALRYGLAGLSAILTALPMGLYLAVILLRKGEARAPFSTKPSETAAMQQMGLIMLAFQLCGICVAVVLLTSSRPWIGHLIGLTCLGLAARSWRRVGYSQ
jgi:ABC-2 type transport system permease protein